LTEIDDNPAITGGTAPEAPPIESNPASYGAPAPSATPSGEPPKEEGKDGKDGNDDKDKEPAPGAPGPSYATTSAHDGAKTDAAGDKPANAKDTDTKSALTGKPGASGAPGNGTAGGNKTDAAWANSVPFGSAVGLFGVAVAGFLL
jgi:hypothetical protein